MAQQITINSDDIKLNNGDFYLKTNGGWSDLIATDTGYATTTISNVITLGTLKEYDKKIKEYIETKLKNLKNIDDEIQYKRIL